MSGGSYEYLYCKEPEDFFLTDAHDVCLLRMADRLRELGYADAADGLMYVRRRVENARERYRKEERELSVVLDEFSDLMKAVEWFDSCDWGREQFDSAVTKWRTSHPGDKEVS